MDGDQLRKKGVVRRPTVTSRSLGDVLPRRLRHVTRSQRHGRCRPTVSDYSLICMHRPLYDRAVNHRGMQQWERNPRIAFRSSPVPSEQQGAVTPSSSSGWASTRGAPRNCRPHLKTLVIYNVPGCWNFPCSLRKMHLIPYIQAKIADGTIPPSIVHAVPKCSRKSPEA